uniref:Generative cell specific-1/HAP2 domain-containing protein n=1 Tax=Timspurckia oligopyrenoides TaxID=708627 RepID=A0A6T6MS87_9RHOD|mmetsp:Transcript_5290/g.9249  ORF Transcript_5290/g.9249 Transcript_5290/m.9249 type:complete len:735 (+) Transcript_5290:613-2817(+)
MTKDCHTQYLIFFRLLCWFLVFFNGWMHCDGIVTGVGQLQQCLDNGIDSSVNSTSIDTDGACSMQYILSVAVQNGQSEDAGSITFGSLQAGIEDPEDSHIAYRFTKQTKIQISKSKIRLRYPLYYVRDVNNLPYEISKQSNSGGPFNWLYNPCRAGWNDDSASCGFFYDPPSSRDAEHRVWDSQGFCCECGLNDYLGIGSDVARAAKECSFFSVFGSSSDHSSHCLRFDPLWYSVFSIGAPDVLFDIQLNVSTCNLNRTAADNRITQSAQNETDNGTEALENCSWTAYELGPESPVAYSEENDVQMRLLGDYAAWQGTTELGNKYFLWPDTCDEFTEECIARISKNPESDEVGRWMLVDRHLITEDGSECNKIGVSHSAFRNQPNPCIQPKNACLFNQPQHLYEEDLELEMQGLAGNYFIRWFGELSLDDMFTENPKLYYETDRYQNSELLVSFPADYLFESISVSSGVISNATIYPFDAYSKNGNLNVSVINRGFRAAEFTVDVECIPDIAPILSKPVFIPAQDQTDITFGIQAESVLGKEHHCFVSLSDSIGRNVSSFSVNVTSFGLTIDRDTQGGEAAGPQESDGDLSLDSVATCVAECPSFFSLVCFMRFRCWKSLVYILLLIVGLLLALFLLVKFGIPMMRRKMKERKERKELEEIRKEEFRKQADIDRGNMKNDNVFKKETQTEHSRDRDGYFVDDPPMHYTSEQRDDPSNTNPSRYSMHASAPPQSF